LIFLTSLSSTTHISGEDELVKAVTNDLAKNYEVWKNLMWQLSTYFSKHVFWDIWEYKG